MDPIILWHSRTSVSHIRETGVFFCCLKIELGNFYIHIEYIQYLYYIRVEPPAKRRRENNAI